MKKTSPISLVLQAVRLIPTLVYASFAIAYLAALLEIKIRLNKRRFKKAFKEVASEEVAEELAEIYAEQIKKIMHFKTS